MSKRKNSEGDTDLPKSKKRKVACSACRKRKVRCEGGLPCKQCEAAGWPCVYESKIKSKQQQELHAQAMRMAMPTGHSMANPYTMYVPHYANNVQQSNIPLPPQNNTATIKSNQPQFYAKVGYPMLAPLPQMQSVFTYNKGYPISPTATSSSSPSSPLSPSTRPLSSPTVNDAPSSPFYSLNLLPQPPNIRGPTNVRQVDEIDTILPPQKREEYLRIFYTHFLPHHVQEYAKSGKANCIFPSLEVNTLQPGVSDATRLQYYTACCLVARGLSDPKTKQLESKLEPLAAKLFNKFSPQVVCCFLMLSRYYWGQDQQLCNHYAKMSISISQELNPEILAKSFSLNKQELLAKRRQQLKQHLHTEDAEQFTSDKFELIDVLVMKMQFIVTFFSDVDQPAPHWRVYIMEKIVDKVSQMYGKLNNSLKVVTFPIEILKNLLTVRTTLIYAFEKLHFSNGIVTNHHKLSFSKEETAKLLTSLESIESFFCSKVGFVPPIIAGGLLGFKVMVLHASDEHGITMILAKRALTMCESNQHLISFSPPVLMSVMHFIAVIAFHRNELDTTERAFAILKKLGKVYSSAAPRIEHVDKLLKQVARKNGVAMLVNMSTPSTTTTNNIAATRSSTVNANQPIQNSSINPPPMRAQATVSNTTATTNDSNSYDDALELDELDTFLANGMFPDADAKRLDFYDVIEWAFSNEGAPSF